MFLRILVVEILHAIQSSGEGLLLSPEALDVLLVLRHGTHMLVVGVPEFLQMVAMSAGGIVECLLHPLDALPQGAMVPQKLILLLREATMRLLELVQHTPEALHRAQAVVHLVELR